MNALECENAKCGRRIERSERVFVKQALGENDRAVFCEGCANKQQMIVGIGQGYWTLAWGVM